MKWTTLHLTYLLYFDRYDWNNQPHPPRPTGGSSPPRGRCKSSRQILTRRRRWLRQVWRTGVGYSDRDSWQASAPLIATKRGTSDHDLDERQVVKSKPPCPWLQVASRSVQDPSEPTARRTLPMCSAHSRYVPLARPEARSSLCVVLEEQASFSLLISYGSWAWFLGFTQSDFILRS